MLFFTKKLKFLLVWANRLICYLEWNVLLMIKSAQKSLITMRFTKTDTWSFLHMFPFFYGYDHARSRGHSRNTPTPRHISPTILVSTLSQSSGGLVQGRIYVANEYPTFAKTMWMVSQKLTFSRQITLNVRQNLSVLMKNVQILG